MATLARTYKRGVSPGLMVAIVTCGSLTSPAAADFGSPPHTDRDGARASVPAAGSTDRVGRIVRRNGTVVTLAPGTKATARADCRKGETLIGGGAEFDYAYGLQTSGPAASRARRWIATAISPEFEVLDQDLRAFAFCAASARRDRVGSIRLVRSDPVAGDPFAVVSATCSTGRKLVGGGSLGTGLGLSGVFLGTSAPSRLLRETWQSVGYDGDTSGVDTMQAFAYCARRQRPDRIGRIVRRAGQVQTVDAGTDKDAFASCRRGERLVGGGAVGTSKGSGYGVQLRISAPDPNTPRRWFVRGYNGSTNEETLRAFAFCARRA